VVTQQLQVEHRTGKVCRPETDVLPLCYTTNMCYVTNHNLCSLLISRMHIAKGQRSRYPASLVTMVTSSVYIYEKAVVSACRGLWPVTSPTCKVCCKTCNPLIIQQGVSVEVLSMIFVLMS